MEVSYSAPAKVIFSGEHSVVYGKPALVSTLNLRLTFSLSDGKSKVKIQPFIKNGSNIILSYLQEKNIPYKKKSYDYQIDSNIPVRRGLGSSAALAVAMAAAFLEFYSEKKFALSIVNNLAYQIEKKIHKNPSGVDNNVICFGGFIYYRKEFEFLKTVSRLNLKIAKKIEERLFLIDSGYPKETTGEMVSWVDQLYRRSPARIYKILNQMEEITKKMTTSFVREDLSLLGEIISKNQSLLTELGVVSLSTRRLLAELSSFGRGKITGAGGREKGSGFILFLASNPNRLLKFCQKRKLKLIKFKQSLTGLRQVEMIK